MQPRQMRETFKPVRPRLTYSMGTPRKRFAEDESKPVWSDSDDCWMSGSGEEFVVDFESLTTETNEKNGVYARSIHVMANCIDGNAGGAVRRKRVDAGADGRKCDGVDIVLVGKLEAAAIAGGEEIIFV